MKLLNDFLKPLLLALVLTAGLSFVSAAWTGPTLPPPNGNVDVPINTSANSQTKTGNLLIQALTSTGAAFQTGFAVMNGNVGVGTSTPRQRLSILGAVGATSFCTTDADGNCTGTIGAPALEYRSNTWVAFNSIASDWVTWKNGSDQRLVGVNPYPSGGLIAMCSLGKHVVGGGCEFHSYISSFIRTSNGNYTQQYLISDDTSGIKLSSDRPADDGSGWVCGANTHSFTLTNVTGSAGSSNSTGVDSYLYSLKATAICQ